MSKNLDFINNIDGRVLYDNSRALSIAIIGDNETQNAFIKAGHKNIEYLDYYLDASIEGLGDSIIAHDLDLKIKDLNECLSLIKPLSFEERIQLAESLINWFEGESINGAFKALSIISR